MKAFGFLLAAPLSASHSLQRGLFPAGSPDQVCAAGLRLWTDRGVGVIDLGTAGRILGVLFSRSSGRRLEALPAHAPLDRGHEVLAAWLLRECWGAYLAILGEPSSGRVQVLADPSGLLPVYRFETATHVLLSSHPALLQKGARTPLRPSWPALHAHLRRPELRQRATCLDGVRELTPAVLVPLTGHDRSALRIWQPSAFIPHGPAMSFGEAAEELRSLAVSVIGAWSRCLGPAEAERSGSSRPGS